MARKAGITEGMTLFPEHLVKAFHIEISERIGPYHTADLFNSVMACDKVLLGRNIGTVIAWEQERRI